MATGYPTCYPVEVAVLHWFQSLTKSRNIMLCLFFVEQKHYFGYVVIKISLGLLLNMVIYHSFSIINCNREREDRVMS